jgi:hypothetical protein
VQQDLHTAIYRLTVDAGNTEDIMNITRRALVSRAAILGGLGLAVPADAKRVDRQPTAVDFSDPLTALRTHVKMVGSLGTGSVVSFMRLNIYADLGEGNYVPFFTMNNILVDYWEPKGDDQYEMRKYEVGFYTRHDTQQPLEEFKNPVTGETLPIHLFRLGPVPRLYTPTGVMAMGYTPKLLPIETIGDRVFLATESIESRPDMLQPGKTSYTNSFMTISAKLDDVLDPDVLSAPAHLQLQNKNRWAPWMGMGDRPGGTVARGFGGKITGLEALPPAVKAGALRLVPEIFDTANWRDFVFEDSEYLKSLDRKTGNP